jgi:hypothetical protein
MHKNIFNNYESYFIITILFKIYKLNKIKNLSIRILITYFRFLILK